MNNVWDCLTIEFKNGTLDLECSSSKQAIRWFMCIQSICPLVGHQIISRSKLHWMRAALKVQMLSALRMISIHDACKELICATRRGIVF